MTFDPKLLIGGTALAVTSAGLGIEALTSSKSSDTNLSTTTKSKTLGKPITVKKQCRLHKLLAIATGSFEPTTKETVKQGTEEIDGSIEKACLENPDKDIFVSKTGNKWGYYDSVQKSSHHINKFETYLKGRSGSQPSSH